MSGALLEVNGISVSFDGFKAINSLSFNIDNGELRAIIGPNGAGKTTFMDIITGKTRPDSGDVIWGEKNISLIRKSESEIANLGVGRKFQKPTIFEDQSVMENLIMALKNNRSPFSVLFYKYNKTDHNKVVNIASDIGLISVLDKLSGELSHGQKQWLEIGMLLAQEPQLLLIDEPAAGMTLEERKHTVLLLKRLSKTRAVVVVEHDMEFIRNLSCKVTVLHEGAVLAEGTLDHVVKNKTVIDVYLGR
jgi:urea transport system ATP-binding protein